MKKRFYLILPLLLLTHFGLLFFLRFTAWPEMLSYPYLVNHGFTLYKDFVHPYPPLLTLVLAGFYKLYGYSEIVLKSLTWIIIILNDILILKIVKKISGSDLFATAAVGLYVFTQPFLEGNQLWFDLAIVAPVLAGTYYLLKEKNIKNLFFSGILFGLAALIKQTSGLFLVVSFIYLIAKTKNVKKVLSFSLGPVILGLGLIMYLVSNNTLLDFAKWNLIYPLTFWSHFPGYVQMNLTNGQMAVLGVLLFPLFFTLAQNYKIIFKDKTLVLLSAFLALGFVMIYPRFSYFHFQLALAFITIIFGYILSKFKFSPVIIAMSAMLVFFVITLPGLKRDIGLDTRFWDSSDIDFSQKIRDQVGDNGVYLLGQPSSLYVLSGTLPPKPWLDNYGWYFEIPGVEEQTLAGWSKNKPEFIITTDPTTGNWYDLGTYRPKQIMNWIDKGYEKKLLLSKGVWIWQMK